MNSTSTSSEFAFVSPGTIGLHHEVSIGACSLRFNSLIEVVGAAIRRFGFPLALCLGTSTWIQRSEMSSRLIFVTMVLSMIVCSVMMSSVVVAILAYSSKKIGPTFRHDNLALVLVCVGWYIYILSEPDYTSIETRHFCLSEAVYLISPRRLIHFSSLRFCWRGILRNGVAKVWYLVSL